MQLRVIQITCAKAKKNSRHKCMISSVTVHRDMKNGYPLVILGRHLETKSNTKQINKTRQIECEKICFAGPI